MPVSTVLYRIPNLGAQAAEAFTSGLRAGMRAYETRRRAAGEDAVGKAAQRAQEARAKFLSSDGSDAEALLEAQTALGEVYGALPAAGMSQNDLKGLFDPVSEALRGQQADLLEISIAKKQQGDPDGLQAFTAAVQNMEGAPATEAMERNGQYVVATMRDPNAEPDVVMADDDALQYMQQVAANEDSAPVIGGMQRQMRAAVRGLDQNRGDIEAAAILRGDSASVLSSRERARAIEEQGRQFDAELPLQQREQSRRESALGLEQQREDRAGAALDLRRDQLALDQDKLALRREALDTTSPAAAPPVQAGSTSALSDAAIRQTLADHPQYLQMYERNPTAFVEQLQARLGGGS